MSSSSPRGRFPECWGHRGASASFPENTLASFEAAIRDGAEGIESDVHVSIDDVVLMFHDPSLERTTNGHGLIRDQKWIGGMEHCRTKKAPIQPIPTFQETVDLLMKPENRQAHFNVDVKIQNDPDRLFRLMHDIISKQPNWEIDLAPRILLGLWHPRFINPARQHLGYLRRSHIGLSPYIARTYFWDACENFSIAFSALCTIEGEKFRRECKDAGKQVMVWTVNTPEQMMEAVRWEVHAILTDAPKAWLNLRAALTSDYAKASRIGRLFLWTSVTCYTPVQMFFWWGQQKRLEQIGGPLEKAFDAAAVSVPAISASS